jgi:hypothetical protein
MASWKFGWLALGVSMLACAPEDAGLNLDEGEDSEAVEVSATGLTYVRVRRDFRRCLSPVCGGYWVSRLNRSTLRCVDGSYRSECYVPAIDWTGLGLEDRALQEFQGLASGGSAVLRGRLEAKVYGRFGNLGELVVTEGWQAANGATPTGVFYHARQTDLVCVRAPCPNVRGQRLNSSAAPLMLAGVDLSTIQGIDRAGQDKGYDYLRQEVGIMVAGSVHRSADGTRALRASQYYLRVSEGVADERYCMADADCTRSVFHAPVRTPDDCYCVFCPSYALNTTSATLWGDQYGRHCQGFRRTCPVPRCIAPRPIGCTAHACGTRIE